MSSDKIVVVNTTSGDDSFGKLLSPFHLGPCKLYGDFTAKNMENAWQFAKVYKHHTDENGNPTNDYWKWAKTGWEDAWAHRYPMGKGAIPEYSLWDGKRLDYIQARKTIYAPVYAKAVLDGTGIERLRGLMGQADEIVLRDFDGYDYQKLEMTLTDVLNNPRRKMGHAFVIAALLTNDESMNQWAKISK